MTTIVGQRLTWNTIGKHYHSNVLLS